MFLTPSLFATPGLLGDGWLYILELARRHVIQPGAAVVPAGATLYCAGVELPPSEAAGFDFTALDKYRCCLISQNKP